MVKLLVAYFTYVRKLWLLSMHLFACIVAVLTPYMYNDSAGHAF